MENTTNKTINKNKFIICLLSGALVVSGGCNIYQIKAIKANEIVITQQANDNKLKTVDFTKLQKSTNAEINKLKQINNKNKIEIDKLTKENNELQKKIADLHIKPQWNP